MYIRIEWKTIKKNLKNDCGFQFIKNKFTGEMATYGFINFDSDAAALMAMHKLNGKIIPNSQPVTFSSEMSVFEKVKQFLIKNSL